MTFEELNLTPQLAAAMTASGFTEPTRIQEIAIPKLINGGNLIGRAPTGTGKTLAYLLPIIQKIDPTSNNVQAVILAPTYELAMQTARAATDFISKIDPPSTIRVLGLIGGANINRQIDALKKKPQIIVGSVGRIIELFHKNKLKLHAVKFLVLDEFDRLLDDQNFNAVIDLKKLLPQRFDCMMFSATSPKKALDRAATFGSFDNVTVDEDKTFAADRQNFFVVADFRDKITKTRKLTNRLDIKRGLVFVNKNFDVERALEKLRYDGIKAASLIGTSDKVSRKNAIADFTNGKVQLLLSTDLAARGLDIPNIDYVINLDFPEDAKMFLHRAGRTARAGQTGVVITIVDPKEMHKLNDLERLLDIKFVKLDERPPRK